MHIDITKVDTTFMRRRREQQIKFERSVLRELSISTLKKSVQQFFGRIKSGAGIVFDQAIEEGCFDIALEVYLLGSRYSRLGYYGEPFEEIKYRSQEELDNFSNALFDFITFWGNIPEDEKVTIQRACHLFIEHWFSEGFHKGKMKYKMRIQ
ncbi:YbaK family protein [Caldibacillus thermolactis]|jgi:hypothetical protein|uniref:YbaK family protein n=1 Tax=Pallidibacillus thermolactis TaxID=251051 RepID=A0ABT2WEI1_9BACI|nr:DUF2521 family protein [Pallidibacillus thermolactis]MCU9594068.1 YbaK family protein [Pallidibacillus thermolactis]MED1673201.1 DUF2521 family protein [Pallidibacillus thermolactis subsp. kokeshiiformis]